MMMAARSDIARTPRREPLSVTTLAPEPAPAEWRARALLALALLNHRQTDAGLSPADCEQTRAALLGEWDEVGA